MQQEREQEGGSITHTRGLKNCRFKVGSRASGEIEVHRIPESTIRFYFICVLHTSGSFLKLHLVIKSVLFSMPTTPFSLSLSPLLFFSPLLLSLSVRRSLGSETAVSVTLEWSSRKALAVRSTRSLSAFMGTWLKRVERTCLPAWGKKGRGAPACHSPSGETSIFFLLCVCVALLPSTGRRGNCGETKDSLCVSHQKEFISNQWKGSLLWVTNLWHLLRSSVNNRAICRLTIFHSHLCALGSFHTNPTQLC